MAKVELEESALPSRKLGDPPLMSIPPFVMDSFILIGYDKVITSPHVTVSPSTVANL